MSVYVPRGFKRTVLQLIYIAYLFFVISLLAQQQDDPCAFTNSVTDDSGGVCGFNGICQVSGHSSSCSCPPGFHFMDNDNPSKGCLQNTSQLQSCDAKGAKMQRIEQIDWPGNDLFYLNLTQTGCQQACLENCFCIVAIYINLNGVDTCWMKAMPMKYGSPNNATVSFVKVYDAVPPTPSEQRKEENGKVLALVGMSVTAVFMFIQLILLILLVKQDKIPSCRRLWQFLSK